MKHPEPTMDASSFVILADFVPGIIQEIRYYSTYNFVGDRIDGYEEPCALLTRDAARALKGVAAEMAVHGLRLKVFDASISTSRSLRTTSGDRNFRNGAVLFLPMALVFDQDGGSAERRD